MNESNRNTRTLIVSFVLAIMVLIPLRFVEVGQSIVDQPQVLGETIVLPNATVETRPVLEAPYDEIENNNCVPKEDARNIVTEATSRLSSGTLSDKETVELTRGLEELQKIICK